MGEFEEGTQRFNRIDDNLNALMDREEKLAAVHKKNDEDLAEKERNLRRLESELNEINKIASQNESKMVEKQKDIASLEKVLKLNRIRSAAKAEELNEKDLRLNDLERHLTDETESVKQLEDEIDSLKVQVVEAQDEQSQIRLITRL